jgi:tRNA pseudouridine55 synthase
MENLNLAVSVWKESDWTSNDVVKFIKPHVYPNKIGHAGTLDPFAKGVLVLCIGKMTKEVSSIMDSKKEYLVKVYLGKRTDSLDVTGNITYTKKYIPQTDKKIKSILKDFEGTIDQIPPMFSALKINGTRLYTLARAGIIIPRKPRKINIEKITLIRSNKKSIVISVRCGKGTYIRSLARDIANRLGTEGFVMELTRTKVGNFNEINSIDSKDLKNWLIYQKLSQN